CSSDLSLYTRRTVAISLRGRGKSDGPEHGYSFEDHVSDVSTTVTELGLNSFCLMAYSMAVPYAISFAIRNPLILRGLIIGDYPARYPAFRPQWIQRALTVNPPDRARPNVVRALQAESTEI